MYVMEFPQLLNLQSLLLNFFTGIVSELCEFESSENRPENLSELFWNWISEKLKPEKQQMESIKMWMPVRGFDRTCKCSNLRRYEWFSSSPCRSWSSDWSRFVWDSSCFAPLRCPRGPICKFASLCRKLWPISSPCNVCWPTIIFSTSLRNIYHFLAENKFDMWCFFSSFALCLVSALTLLDIIQKWERSFSIYSAV